ncbi:hypothetical protein CCP2SC5_160040 [Azospirillaceae bacterium]
MTAMLMRCCADDLTQLAIAVEAHVLTIGKQLSIDQKSFSALRRLQAGDIAAQRIHHAAEAFAVLAGLTTTEPDLIGVGCRLQVMQLHAAADAFGMNASAIAEIIENDNADGRDIIARLRTLCDSAEAIAVTAPDEIILRKRLIQILNPCYVMDAERDVLARFLSGETSIASIATASIATASTADVRDAAQTLDDGKAEVEENDVEEDDIESAFL